MSRSASAEKLPIAVSIGDPSGIGPDVLLSAFSNQRAELPENFVVFADRLQLENRARELNINVEFRDYDPKSNRAASSNHLNLIPLNHSMTGKVGKPSPADVAGTLEAIERAVEMVFKSEASALVT